jgi:hypothetical protein
MSGDSDGDGAVALASTSGPGRIGSLVLLGGRPLFGPAAAAEAAAAPGETYDADSTEEVEGGDSGSDTDRGSAYSAYSASDVAMAFIESNLHIPLHCSGGGGGAEGGGGQAVRDRLKKTVSRVKLLSGVAAGMAVAERSVGEVTDEFLRCADTHAMELAQSYRDAAARCIADRCMAHSPPLPPRQCRLCRL